MGLAQSWEKSLRAEGPPALLIWGTLHVGAAGIALPLEQTILGH